MSAWNETLVGACVLLLLVASPLASRRATAECVGNPDGACVVGEECDDNNDVYGDGCDPTCHVELDYDCGPCNGGQSVCTQVNVCENQVPDGLCNPQAQEHCDLGTGGGPGCNASCHTEPTYNCDCKAGQPSVCKQVCVPGGPFKNDLTGPPEQIGDWSDPIDLGFEAIHASLLHTGSVLMWTGGGVASSQTTAYLWDPAQPASTTPVPSVDHALLCTGHATLGDGRLLVVGGETGNLRNASERIYVYDPDQPSLGFQEVESMHRKRWYPSATTMADGRVAVTSGVAVDGRRVDHHEVYHPVHDRWKLVSPPYVRMMGEYPMVFWHTEGFLINPTKFSSATPAWRLAPGDVFESWGNVGTLDATLRTSGSGATYAPDRFFKMGTGRPDGRFRAATYDASSAGSRLWESTAADPDDIEDPGYPLYPRGRSNLVILPTGRLLTVGGSNRVGGPGIVFPNAQEEPECAVLGAEAWDPSSNTWEQWDDMRTPRIYHSVALLLPDGRVLAAGGENSHAHSNGSPSANLNAEIFSPPYMFSPDRPGIVFATASVEWSTPAAPSQFFVITESATQAASVTRIVLIRPGSTTHNFDENSRYIELDASSFSVSSQTLTVTAPLASEHPPGYYMVFVLAGDVPSEARFVRFYSNLDGDQFVDDEDPCVGATGIANSADGDLDRVPDFCDQHPNQNDYADADGDGVLDEDDNCPDRYNPAQSPADSDQDEVPNDCDRCEGVWDTGPLLADQDGDSIPDACDKCPTMAPNPDPEVAGDDIDADGIENACDNCPTTWNPNQENRGGTEGGGYTVDDVGDACQCGDVNDDGRVTGTDRTFINRTCQAMAPYDVYPTCGAGDYAGAGCCSVSHWPPGSPTPFVHEKCDVDGSGDCTTADADLIGAGGPLVNACSAAVNP